MTGIKKLIVPGRRLKHRVKIIFLYDAYKILIYCNNLRVVKLI